jgi:hypothetical protein
MAKKGGPYQKRRRKVNKEELKKSPFKDEVKTNRNKKVVGAIAATIAILMVATLLLPYFTGGGSANYRLPDEVLTAQEDTENVQFSPQSILVGQVFEQPEEEYYVLFGTPENTMELTAELARVAYYTVDPDNALNSFILEDLGGASNLPQTPAEIRLNGDIALIKIVNNRAVEFVTGRADVEALINSIED